MKKNKVNQTKYYVTNGFNKQVITASSPYEATVKMLNYIMGVTTDNEEHCEFYPFSVVSECGFLEDLVSSMNFDELDKCVAYKTSEVFTNLGRKDIANGMRKFEKSLSLEMRKFLEAMTKEPTPITKESIGEDSKNGKAT